MEFKVLAVGDVVGNPGLERIRRNLRQLKRKTGADFVVVNGENAAVVGITPDQAEDILDAGADCITMGNHTWGKREIVNYMDDCPQIIRPANYAPQVPGRGWQVFDTKAGDVAVIDLIGRCNMDYGPDNPFLQIDKILKQILTEEEYNGFYQDKFYDYTKPLATIHTSAEGTVSYKALMYIPAKAPFDFYTKDYKRGLQLYSSGVMIMENCEDLLPEHFRFVRGVVDSQDLSLNISREMLQHDRQLKVIANNIEKKIRAELVKLMKDDREKYEKFWSAFGMNFKYALMNSYGEARDAIRDLLLFWSSKENAMTTIEAYKDRMSEEQPYFYYACGESVERIAQLPQVERILDKGYEILYCTEDVDDFLMKALAEVDGKKFKSVNDEDALPQSEEEKKAAEEKAEAGKPVLEAVKEVLGDRVKEVRVSSILKSAACCLTADGPISLEMEKYLSKMEGAGEVKAQRVLELNPAAKAFAALQRAFEHDKDKAARYAEVLYCQSLLIAGLPLEDPAAYAELVCSLMD